MHKKGIATITLAAIIANMSASTVEVLAHEVNNIKKSNLEVSNKNESSKLSINKFNLYNSDKLNAYDTEFKMNNSNIKSVTNNGGVYGKSTIDKATDGNLSTHWETGKANNSDFTNEVVFTFNEVTNLNRVVYAARQDGAKGKGFAQEVEIYASLTEEGDNFRLVGTGEYKGSTGDLVEIKFNSTDFKRLKFKFKKANQNWASASEFMFYKEDAVSDKIENLFTDSTMSKVSEEFNSVDKINKLEEDVKNHPLYEDFKEQLENAKQLINKKKVVYTDANVSKFKDINSDKLPAYNEIYKVPSSNIKSITNNGGHYASEVIKNSIDGNAQTKWHSGKQNTSSFTNEVVIELNDITTLNRIVYTSPRGTKRGFAEQFDIYASVTSTGDTFELVSSGKATPTQDSVEIRFNPTEFKRVKFVFKKGYENWACAAEFGLYTQDETAEKVQRLFADSNMSKISEEFNTIEKIKALEEEAKTHPFYEDYKEDIENAIALVEKGEVLYTDTTISKVEYDAETKEKYDAQYKISKDKIKGITNNGGHYGTSVISNLIDGDVNTNWHSGKQNTSSFTNEFTIELKSVEVLDKIIYTTPKGTNRGFPEGFEIYASTTSKGDNFELVSKGATQATQGELEFKFKPTKFKRIKFVFTNGYENWACGAEIGLYKEDKITDKVNSVFEDNVMTKLSQEYNTIEAISAIENEVKGHPLEKEHMEIINLAKEMINEPGKVQSTVMEFDSRGDSEKESRKRKMWSFKDWQPTGLAVKGGQTITVYVDVESGKPAPELVFKQIDTQNNGIVVTKLTNGKNVVTIPEFNSDQIRPGTPKAGVLYINNPYTPEEQGRKPKVRIEGAFSYPHYVKGIDNDEDVMRELREYVEKLKEDPSLPDVFDIFGDKTLSNVRASYALNWYTENNKVPSYTANKSDEVVKETMRFWGYDGSSELNSDFNFRYVSMLKWINVFMNAGNGITGFNEAQQDAVLNANTGWGLMHEMGHNFDTGNRNIVEVTNNILPLHFQRLKKEESKISQQNLWESNIFPKVSKEDYSNNEWYPERDKSLLTHLAPLWQLSLYDDKFWPRFEQEFRARDIGGGSWENKHEAWAVVASDVLQLDLKEHFARHGFYVSEETANHMSQYPKPTKKLWYLNDNKYLKSGQGFNNDVQMTLESKLNGNSAILNFDIDKENSNSLLGYEIYRDGEVIGFTTKNSFTDDGITEGVNHEYKIVAYDINLNTYEASVKTFKPIIETAKGVTLGLGEEFNPLDYVKATDYKGNKLDEIKCISDVDNTKKGNYTVTYEVEDKGSVTKKTMNVSVVSKYDYLSDSEWKSVQTGWGTPTRNNSIKGRLLGEIKEFDKGIRIHANGNVVYDLGEHNYDNLELMVGVDMNMEAQNNSSITFKVIGDGKTLATTKVLKHADDLQYINVPISGVRELKIEVNDGGNGNTADHGIIVEPKLTTNNAKPSLEIPKSQSVKVGEDIDNILGQYRAIDAEDGDLTNNVVVTGQDKVNVNRPGDYKITYSVTDRDGNQVEKSRTISVFDEQDFKYLSDYDWKSAKSGWGSVNKDKSVSNNKLRLTGEDGSEVVYDKGIGTHATSTIVYDLTDKNVNYFSTYVGVDRAMYNSVGRVQFEVYVDGKKVYDSGVMNANDPQKFVEVDLLGAKELKLVVKDGGNGIGSDHATWADAKLYSVNTERVYINELTTILEEAKKLDKDNYTDESYETLANSIAKAEELLKEDKPSQDFIDAVKKELQDNVESLIEINLNEIVNIPDKYLTKSLSEALGKEGNFTIGDMRKLINFNLGYGVESLEGLQYAKNLEVINGEYNEIKDLRPISKLDKLREVNLNNQFVQGGEINSVDGVIKVNTEVYNREGNSVATKVELVDNKGNVLKEKSLSKNTKEVDLDVSDLESGFYGVHVTFEDPEISGKLIYTLINM
ncbi:MAG: NPCBM/NEW2 domain-containing protein [Romboutsia timonensis]|nr:NPCBM/NEW2 domain-containing protein [Romboutsia timonensis]